MVTKKIITKQRFGGMRAMIGDDVIACVDYQDNGRDGYLRCGKITFINDSDEPMMTLFPYEEYMPMAHHANAFMGEYVDARTVDMIMAMQPGQWTFQSHVLR